MMVTHKYSVPNISCGHCVMTIQRELKDLQGLLKVEADENSKTVVVEVESPEILKNVEKLLDEIGYPVADPV
jgi:copper chaperone CopZ